jgi:Asp-tRNA(Asn)/Glu-tRNA(Gln) amidotransferase A subunit family amidase
MSDEGSHIRELLRRIRAEEASLKAFTYIAEDPTGPVAGPSPERPLGGLPIAIKDVVDTADMPTGYGSHIYDGHQPAMDGAIVTALKQAGAFIVGKTTTTEFATSPPTKTLNPRGARFTPGGSSAGSAAAVAAGLVRIALGTQTLGSVVRPASFCGVVGFKPGHGWFPSAGMKQLAPSLDTIGFLSAEVADCEQAYRALVPDDADPSPHMMRLAFSRQPNWERATPDARAAIEACIAALRGTGAVIDDVEMPAGFDAMDATANVIHDYEMHRTLRPELVKARDKIDPALVARIERAGRWSVTDYRKAQATAVAQRLAFSSFMKSYDAVLCLAAGGEAPLLEEATTGDPLMNSSWTALYVPCITLPAMSGANGMPIGLQLVADRHRELKLLRIAAAIEKLLLSTPSSDRRG